MALFINGTKIKKVNFNGALLQQLTINGVRVWVNEITIRPPSG